MADLDLIMPNSEKLVLHWKIKKSTWYITVTCSFISDREGDGRKCKD